MGCRCEIGENWPIQLDFYLGGNSMDYCKKKSINFPMFVKKSKSLSEIEDEVDRILLEYKRQSKNGAETNIDFERFSLKSKGGKSIYFLRAKLKMDMEDKKTKSLSGKIISEARNNLGERANKNTKKSNKSGDVEIKIDKNFTKKSSRKLDKKEEKRIDERIQVRNKKETKIKLHKSKFFKRKNGKTTTKEKEKHEQKLERPANIKLQDTIAKEKGRNDNDWSDLLDKIIKECYIKVETEHEDGDLEIKAKKLAKEHRIFQKRSRLEKAVEGKGDSAVLRDELQQNNLPSQSESKLLGEKISRWSDTQQHEIEPTVKTKKGKRSFFKKKKSIKITDENVEDKQENKPEVPPQSLFKFKVENLPEAGRINENEVDLLNEKIEKTPEKIVSENEENQAEEKAKKLASEHISSNKITEEDNPITNQEEMFKHLVASRTSEEEHVFFDEANSDFTGWSPQITDKERRSIGAPILENYELTDYDFKLDKDIELPKEVLKNTAVTLSDLGFSENEWEELDFYPLREPFAYVEILRKKESLEKCYFLVEVELTSEEKETLDFIIDTMGKLNINTFELESSGENEYLKERVERISNEYGLKMDKDSKEKILYYIEKSSIGFGRISPIMNDPNIEDISCDGAGVPIFLYHRKYGSLKSNVKYDEEGELSSFIFKLAQKCGKHISIAEPMLDATMPDGSRIQMTLSDEITAKGSTFTIRKFREDPFSPPDLVEFNTMSSEMVAYMWLAVENGINTLFAGGTASGKTTTLNALILFVPREAKIVSIEETREINLPHPNWIPGVARSGFGEIVADRMVGEIDMYDLMKAALRQRPEYIIVGEIRGREAYVLFQAMATGHATYSTVHADSAQSLIHRLEGKPIEIPRVMLQSLDIVSLHVITRVKNNRARRCKQIIEIIDIDPTTKEILTNEVFRWDPVEDKFIYTGKSYILERIRAEKDMTRDEMTNEIKNRKNIIEWMNKNNVREFRDVARLVARYAEDPNSVVDQVMKDVN